MNQIPTWGDNRKIRIGLLGGSFNPIHQGHLHIAAQALKILRLHQVWLMVSPGNPLKEGKPMAPFMERLKKVQQSVNHKTMMATDIEKRLGTYYTYDTIKLLKKRFPKSDFVWLMGADGLAQMFYWLQWKQIVQNIPIAVFPRPGYRYQALNGQVASFLRKYRLSYRQASLLAGHFTPVWCFLSLRENNLSATAIRKQVDNNLYMKE